MLSLLTTLASRPRQTLAALAVALLGIGVAAGSGASFTATLAEPVGTFSAGTLSIGGASAAALNVANLRPGDVRPRSVDIENTGTVAGSFSLRSANTVDAAGLLDVLQLAIRDCGRYADAAAPACDGADPLLYDGAVSGLPGGPGVLDLGPYAADERHRYELVVRFPSASPDVRGGVGGAVAPGARFGTVLLLGSLF